jgi:hypothetical protein
LIGGEKLLKPALRLMSDYRLRIDEIKGAEVITSLPGGLNPSKRGGRKIRKFI